MNGRLRLGRRQLIAIWLGASFVVASYYNACGKVVFDQSSSARLSDMQSSAMIMINNNDTYTKSDLVDLTLASHQSDEVYVTNDSTCAGGGKWEPLHDHQNWTLAQRNADAPVFAKFRSTLEGVETSCVSDSIIHDDIKPEVVLGAPSSATNVAVPIVQFVASDNLSGVDKQICDWPGKGPGDCDHSTSNGNLAEGRYLLRISATDKAGNSSDPVTHDLTVDRTPPNIVILSGPPSLSASGAVNLGFNAVDDRSGLKSVECAFENKAAYAACVSPVAKSVSEGQHMLYIRARDLAGNEAEISRPFTVDMTAPTVTITSGPSDYSKSSAATFEFTGKDGNNPITSFECRLDGGAYTACASPKSYTSLSEGLHSFEVRGYDAAQNLSAPASRSWYVDVTPPAITFLRTPPAYTKMNTAEFNYSVSDSGSGVAKTQCNFDGAGYQDCAADAKSFAGLSEGRHTFRVRAYDKADNMGESQLVTFTVDTKPPTVQFTDTPGSISKLTRFTFKFDAKDDQGLERVECRIDAQAYVACETVTAHEVANLSDGNHQFTVRAVDKAGNMSAEATHSWMVDVSAPAITYYQLPPVSILTTEIVTLGFTAADTGSGLKTVTCALDNVAVNCASGVLLTLPMLTAGTHSFQVSATDNAGNMVTDTKTITASAPVLHLQTVSVNANPKVDVIVIVDNSGSMSTEQANMAARVSTFIQKLGNLDWQIGVITTDVDNDNVRKDGRLVELKDLAGKYIITPATPNAQTVFGNTVQLGSSGSGAEQGFKAFIRAVDRAFDTSKPVNAPNTALFRPDAALAAIVLSDAYDTSGVTPENVIAKVKERWPNKSFAWHSIVVPSSQYTDPNKSSPIAGDPCASYRESVKYDGREYHRLSMLTGGVQGNECTEDWGTQLADIGKVTADLVTSIALDCNPIDYNNDGKIDMGDVQVYDGMNKPVTGFTVQGAKISFASALPVGNNSVRYHCTQ